MPKLMRAILSKRNKWAWDEPPLSWLDDGDIPAGPLLHIIPDDHKISVYEVHGDQARINKVAAAISAGKEKLDAVEYIVIEEADIVDVGIEIDDRELGETYDPEVNQWHRDLTNISATKLVALGRRILPKTISDWVLEKTVNEVFSETIKTNNQKIDWSHVKLKKKAEFRQGLAGDGGRTAS